MPVREAIVAKLSAKFVPTTLEVIDESARHQGHAGSRPDGETNFRIRIVADSLSGKSRLEQHRAIMEALSDELRDRIHALAIEVRTPS